MDKESESRPQQGGEAGTTRFGLEDGDNTDVSATGGPDEAAPEADDVRAQKAEEEAEKLGDFA